MIKRILLLVCLLAPAAHAQVGGRVTVGTFAARPTTCSAGDLYVTSDTNLIYQCGPANTWTVVPELNAPNAFTGNNTFANFNKTVYVDGNTFQLTCAGIQAAIISAGSNSHIVLPPNTSFSACSANTISMAGLNNVLLEGGGDSTILTASGSSAMNVITVAGVGAGASANLASNAVEGSNVITLTSGGASSIGAVAGAYYLLTDSAATPNAQTGRITFVTGDVITSDDPIYAPGGFTTANSAKMQIVSMSTGIRIRNLKIDVSGNSNSASNGISMNNCAGCEIGYVPITGAPSAAVTAFVGHSNNFHDIPITNSGNGGAAAFYSWWQTHPAMNNVTVQHLSPLAFGFTMAYFHDATATNLVSTGSQTSGGGRGFKLATSSYGHYTNLDVENVIGGFNGISITANSTHNTFTACKALNNTGAGIQTFGGGNTFNSFIGCKSKYNAGDQFSQLATGDDHTEIIGGEYGPQRGAAVNIILASANFKVLGATIFDDNGQSTGGLGFGTASNGTAIGNVFKGLPASNDISNLASVTNTMFAFNQVPDGVSRAGTNNGFWSNSGDVGGSVVPGIPSLSVGSSLQWIESANGPSAGAGSDSCYADATAHALKCSYNNGTFFKQTQTIASGTSAMTTALIAAGACGTTVTTTATGVLTTDTINDDFNAAATAANNGLLIFHKWPTAGNVNFNYCNPGAAGVTPTAMTVNWSVVR